MVRKVAETLGVSNVLEGSVRRAGDPPPYHCAADQCRRRHPSSLVSTLLIADMTDVFVIQDEIGRGDLRRASTTAGSARAAGEYRSRTGTTRRASINARGYTPESLVS